MSKLMKIKFMIWLKVLKGVTIDQISFMRMDYKRISFPPITSILIFGSIPMIETNLKSIKYSTKSLTDQN